jgi:hydroxymethylbilane synthase
MKDVPIQLAEGIQQAAVLKRASHKDILVYKSDTVFLNDFNSEATIATSSIRRIAQWHHRYPNHIFENLRGNVNTRLRKLQENNWQGAIFAAAGLERIQLRPENSVDLDWMLPAPAQGAIMVACRLDDNFAFESCQPFNDEPTALCTKIERDFLKILLGGCSTPISAFAEIKNEEVHMKGNITSPDGTQKAEIEKKINVGAASNLGEKAAIEILLQGGQHIIDNIREKGLLFNGEV